VNVVVRCDAPTGEQDRLRFDVTDTGIGISQEVLPALFQPFSQADASNSRRFGGSGLGLAISKRLAEMLGGDISVTSDLGKGSTFSVFIATGLPERATVTPTSPEPTDAPPTPSGQPQCEGRVLLAEDAPDNQRLISLLLRKAGFEFTLAENGQRALDLALAATEAERPFDAILMDIQMPVMDGYEATRRLRDAGYRKPIIALTANAMTEDRQRCLDAGCDDYLSKPVKKQDLLRLLNAWVAENRTPATALPPVN
ncbi:MAG: response regulator, partial [Verrucomicrobia bacterium]|nr:response regulator [Verrucomicrobiota bacterium]